MEPLGAFDFGFRGQPLGAPAARRHLARVNRRLVSLREASTRPLGAQASRLHLRAFQAPLGAQAAQASRLHLEASRLTGSTRRLGL